MLVTVLLRSPVVFAYICINIDFTIFFFLNDRICLLIPENIRIDIFYVSSVCTCKIIRKFFHIRLAAILDFAILDHFLDL